MLTTQYPHLVLLPGLVNDSRLWQHQASGLVGIAHVSVGDLTKGHRIAEMVSMITDMALSLGNKTFIRQQRAIAGRIDSIPSLALIKCPTLN